MGRGVRMYRKNSTKPKPLPKELQELAKKYGIHLTRDVDNMPDNCVRHAKKIV